jgi:hypothetical protein
MDLDLDFEIYKGKKYSSLLKDIVLNCEDRNDKIDQLIDQLKGMVKTSSDAVIIIPMIRDYLDVVVKNDEQLVKLAAIVQRLMASNNSNNDDSGLTMGLTDEEKKALLAEANTIIKELNSSEKDVGKNTKT